MFKRGMNRYQLAYNAVMGVVLCLLPFIFLADRLFTYQYCLAFCAVVLCCLSIVIILKKRAFINVTPSDIFVSLYLTYGVIHYFTYQEELAYYLFSHWTILIAIYFITRNINNNSLLPFFLYVSCTLQALIAIGQCVGIIDSNHLLFCSTGSFWNPSQLGGFIACFFPFIVKEFFTRKFPIWYGLCFLPIIFALVLSDSRAAWFSCFVGLLYVFPVKIKNKSIIGIMLLIAILVIVLLYFYKPNSALGRLNIWIVCVDMIQVRPLWGHGIHSFAEKYMYWQADYFKDNPESAFADMASYVTTPYNEYIHVLTEQGFIGFFLFVLVLGSFFYFSRGDENKKLKTVILSFIIFACFSYPGENVALLFGLIVCMGTIQEKVIIRIPTKSFNQLIMTSIIVCSFFVNIGTMKVYHSLTFMIKHNQILNPSCFKNELEALYYLLQSGMKSDINSRLQIQEWIALKQPSPENFCVLGELCEHLRMYDKAEKYYQIAADIIPNQVQGKYRLFKLFEKNDRSEDAYRIATIISKQHIKIENTFTLGVQGEVKRYLREFRINNVSIE